MGATLAWPLVIACVASTACAGGGASQRDAKRDEGEATAMRAELKALTARQSALEARLKALELERTAAKSGAVEAQRGSKGAKAGAVKRSAGASLVPAHLVRVELTPEDVSEPVPPLSTRIEVREPSEETVEALGSREDSGAQDGS